MTVLFSSKAEMLKTRVLTDSASGNSSPLIDGKLCIIKSWKRQRIFVS